MRCSQEEQLLKDHEQLEEELNKKRRCVCAELSLWGWMDRWMDRWMDGWMDGEGLVVPCAFFARVLTCRVHIPFFVLLCLHCSELDAARQGFEKEKLAFERELEQLRAAQPTGRRKKFF